MVAIYLGALGLGVGTLALQLVSDHDHDAGDGDAAGHDGWLFLSIRFWTFALLASGLVGSALSLLHLAGPIGTALLAAGSGLGAGFGTSATMRALRRGSVSSSASLQEAVGQVGKLLLPVGPGQPGKVRLALRGQTVDVLAASEDVSLPAATAVVVAEVRDGVALVTAAPKELEP